MTGVYIVGLRHRLDVPLAPVAVAVRVVEPVAKAVTYGRCAGDRLVDFAGGDVQFGYVDFLAATSTPGDEHGTNTFDALYAGKAT